MENQLFLIEYGSAHWADDSSHCVVNAPSAEAAEDIAEDFMHSDMAELYSSEYEEEVEQGNDLLENESAHSVIGIEPFGPTHEYWKYFKDPTQSQFFPLIN